MNILIFDTETTGLDKPFCYDVGYYIYDTDNSQAIVRKHFVIEQVWHNLPLFESAYYKDKRPAYVQLMRQHKAEMNKWGYVMQEIKRDIRKHGVTDAYAYNSDFDDKVFAFNCDWFKCTNPLDTIAIHDIWGYASRFITCTESYHNFCEVHELFTDTGNYKGSAEAVYRYLQDDNSFEEAHMGLYDVDIETTILSYCVNSLSAQWNTDYQVSRILPRDKATPFTVKVNGAPIYSGVYKKKYVRNDVYNFTLAEEG